VQRIDFSIDALTSPDVEKLLRSWINEKVIPHSVKSKALLSAFAKARLSEMTGEEWLEIITLVTTSFGVGIAVGKMVPTIFH
jgi:uncharacterized membrane protein YbaN (DUF454 family)